MKYLKLLFFISIIGSLLAACSSSSSNKEINKNQAKDSSSVLNIYTTIYTLQDFTEKIGGDHVKVSNIVPTGSDAHSFEPTAKTMIKISEGSAFIYMGTGIEGFSDAVVDAVGEEKVKIVKAGEGIKLIDSLNSEDDHEGKNGENEEDHQEEQGNKDPHVWIDPIRSIQLAENIKNALVNLKPEAKKEFEKNYSTLKEKLENLDLKFKKMVKEEPKNKFIVSHAAYGYWAYRYNLNQIGISGLSPTDEPSQKELQEIIEIAKVIYPIFSLNRTPITM